MAVKWRRSRERKCRPGGDDSSGKDRSSLEDISSSLILGEFCQLHCTFGLIFLFQFIPLSFEVVKVASARLAERFGQTHGGVRCGWKIHNLGLLGHGPDRVKGFLLSGLEGFDLCGYLFVCLFSEQLDFCVSQMSVHR